MQISQILSYTDSLLHPNEYKDYAPNGLQVQGDGREIRKKKPSVSEPMRFSFTTAGSGSTTMRALSEFNTPASQRF